MRVGTFAVVDHRVVFVRQLLGRAVAAAEDASEFGLMNALLGADLCVETLNKLALSDRVRGQENAVASDLVESMKKEFHALASEPAMEVPKRLRKARNHVQHEAHVPARGEVNRHLEDTTQYVALVLRTIFGVELRAVSFVSLVREPNLRAALEGSRQHAIDGNLVEAAAWLGAAFEVLVGRVDSWLRAAAGEDLSRDGLRGMILRHSLHHVFGASPPDGCPPVRERGELRDALLRIGLDPRDLFILRRLYDAAEEVCSTRFSEDQKQEHETGVHLNQQRPFAREELLPGTSADGRRLACDEVARIVDALATRIWTLECEAPHLIEGPHPEAPRFKYPL